MPEESIYRRYIPAIKPPVGATGRAYWLAFSAGTLLTHNIAFRGGMHSIIAGFVEPGESLEECIRREVLEEAGVRVKNIRYFSSQPWPFPNSLMIGFLADYESGEIKVDGTEISQAGWFDADHLPDVPPKMSIAREIIDWFVSEHSAKK